MKGQLPNPYARIQTSPLKSRWGLGYFLFLFFILCSTNTLLSSSWAITNMPNCSMNSCLYTLKSKSDLQNFSLDSPTPLGTRASLKVIYLRDRQGGGRIYFINTKNYPYHLDFVQQALRIRISHAEFNKHYEGDGEKRDFNMGTLVYLPQDEKHPQGMLLLELWSGDSLSRPYLQEFFQALQRKIGWPVPLLFHPLGINQEKMAEKANDFLPVITTHELYQNQTHQILNEGEAYGYLRFIEGKGQDGENPTEEPCLDHTHIAVYKNVPNDMGLVGGIITEEFQTPLSHINIKSMNRGTVNLAIKNAFEKLQVYKDRPIKLKVTGKGYEITPLSPEQAKVLMAKFWQEKRPKNNLRPTFHLNTLWGRDFVPFKSLFRERLALNRENHQKMIRIMGAKATNLAVLSALMPDKQQNQLGVYIPDGYGVPFDFYEEFMKTPQTGLDPSHPQRVSTPEEMILEKLQQNDLLSEGEFHSICKARPVLQSIRSMVEKAKVSPQLLELFKKYLIDDPTSPLHQSKVGKIRLRSSTNSEDLEGFNGAGLYNSTGLGLYKEFEDQEDIMDKDRPLNWAGIQKKLIKKIPYVYSSVWNDRAFEEREWFSLNGRKHLDVKVGITLNRAFPAVDVTGEQGEGGNGVALTQNIFNQNDSGKIYLNGQHYDLSVTNPPTREELEHQGENPDRPYQTEEILVTTYMADPAHDARPDSWKEWSYEVLSRSSVKDGAPVLLDEQTVKDDARQMETRRLTKALKGLSSGFANLYGVDPETFILDTEWKIYGPDRKLWIKQARPLDFKRK